MRRPQQRHSFPTRRSSDLDSGFFEGNIPAITLSLRGIMYAQIDVVGTEVDLGVHDAAQAERDRKSTRLNSSHGYISYAVFCLKKKNKNLPINFQLMPIRNT